MTEEQYDSIKWGKKLRVKDNRGVSIQVREAVIEGRKLFASEVRFGHNPATNIRMDFFETKEQAANADISTYKNVVHSYAIR